jgi:hypothetical protein
MSQTTDKPTENQNFAAKLREAQKEIDRLTHELDVARAACAEFVRKFQFLEEYWNGNHNEMAMADALERMLQVCEEAVQPSPGQPLLDELVRLRRLEAAMKAGKKDAAAAAPLPTGLDLNTVPRRAKR